MSTPEFIFETDTHENTSGQNNTPFTVVGFTGREGISELFEFTLTIKASSQLASYFAMDDNGSPAMTIMEDNATFSMLHDGVVKKFEGMISECSEGHYPLDENTESGDRFKYYEIVLVPWLFDETQNESSQVYTSPGDNLYTIDTILQSEFDQICTSLSLNSGYLDKALLSTYQGRPFTCQYKESNFNFISRLMEKYGIYYYYDPISSKFMVDDGKAYTELGDLFSIGTINLTLNPDATGDQFYSTIKTKTQKNKRIPSCVTISQFNPDQPSFRISNTYPSGKNTRYGVTLSENVQNEDEAIQIAQIRYEELLCHSRLISGESGYCLLTPGYTVEVNDGGDIHDLLITEIEHSGTNLDFAGTSTSPQYINNYVAINSAKQFRPARGTPIPNANNTETGTVYADQTNPTYAEIDSEGRYRIEFNFIDHGKNVDSSSSEEEKRKVSYWLRKAESAAGTVDSSIIPLKPGVEVTISFIGGDPDLPIISAALSNARFPASVTATNPNHALIATSGLLGFKANGGFYENVKTELDVISDSPDDFDFPVFDPATTSRSITEQLDKSTEMSGDYLIERAYGDEYEVRYGNSFRYLTNESEYVIGTAYLEQHVKDSTSALIDYATLDTAVSLNSHEFPGIYASASGNSKSSANAIVEKTWGDTFNYHNGTSHNWTDCSDAPNGGGREYNFGQGYTVNFFDATTETGEDFYELADEDHADLLGIDGFSQDLNQGLASFINPGASQKLSEAFDKGEAKTGNTFHDITKTSGDTYDFHKGEELNVHIGETVDIVYGDTAIFTQGDSFEHFNGHSGWYFNGGHDSFMMGRTTSTHMGYKLDNFLGVSEEMHIVGKIDMFFGFKLETFLGGRKELAKEIKTASTKKDEATLKTMIASLSIMENTTKMSINASSISLNGAAFVKTNTTMFSVKAAAANINGVITKLG